MNKEMIYTIKKELVTYLDATITLNCYADSTLTLYATNDRVKVEINVISNGAYYNGMDMEEVIMTPVEYISYRVWSYSLNGIVYD